MQPQSGPPKRGKGPVGAGPLPKSKIIQPGEDNPNAARPQDDHPSPDSRADARYPQAPGFKGAVDGPGADAAAYYAPQVSGRRRQVLNGLRAIGGRGTAEQIGAHIRLHWYLVRPRLSECKALGLVIETGDRAASALGGQATVWRETTADELSLHLARKAAHAEKMGDDHG